MPYWTLVCKFHGSDCYQNYTTYRTNIVDWVEALNELRIQAKADYDQLDAECTTAANLLQARADCSTLKQAWMDKSVECSTKYGQRQVAVCEFGDRLASKCTHSSEYLELIAKVDALNGTWHSDPDRRAEHHVIELIMCMLNSYVYDGRDTIDAQTMSTCLATGMQPYSTVIGVLDKKMDEYNALMTAASFTCQEATILFDVNGSWVTPNYTDPYPPYSADYVLQLTGEQVIDIMGDVFATCTNL
jgi:hypothetical protein